MKNTLFITLLLLIGIDANAQLSPLSQSDVQKIKNATLIVALSEDQSFNEEFQSTLKEWWTFCKIGESLPLKEAKKKSKEEKGYYISIESVKSESARHYKNGGYTSSISDGWAICIKQNRENVVKTFIPTYKNEEVDKAILVFGISTMQDMLVSMDKKQMKNFYGMPDVWKENAPGLKEKTLLIPDFWIHSKMDQQIIKQYYAGNYKVVDYDTWSKAIINKDKQYAYIMVVPVPVGGDYVYQHHLVSTENGLEYGVTQPKVGVKIGGFNVTKSNSGYIKEENVKMYGEVINGTR